MSTGKRITTIILFLLEIIFIWLPTELDNLYNTRLGFMRQILFMNEEYPVKIAFWVSMIIGLIGLIVLIRWAIQRIQIKYLGRYLRYFWLLIILVILIVFMVTPANIANPLYLYDLLSFSIALLLQLIVIFSLRNV